LIEEFTTSKKNKTAIDHHYKGSLLSESAQKRVRMGYQGNYQTGSIDGLVKHQKF
jgi:hypothetical protein